MKPKDGKGRFAPKVVKGEQVRRSVEHVIPKQAQPKQQKRQNGKR